MNKLFAGTSALFASVVLAGSSLAQAATEFTIRGSQSSQLAAEVIAEVAQPWAMTFVDDSTLLVTSKPGQLFLVSTSGTKQEVAGVPEVAYGGQGGLGDIVLAGDFATSQRVLLSYAEPSSDRNRRGAVVISAKLQRDPTPKLLELRRIWTQLPKVTGRGHYGHRIAIGPAGSDQAGKLFITSGDRQKLDPAQDWDSSLGKVIRLNADGSVPTDNPWQNKGKLAKSFWSIGHRNPLGIAFDSQGKLWVHEMGPRHGDELNLIHSGKNYGWPLVSNGNHYSGRPIPNHNTRPEFQAPATFWVPSIAPSGFVIYSGKHFPRWQGNGFIGGLVSRALVRVELDGNSAREVERFEWGRRIREVEQAPDGTLWVLEDGSPGRLLRLTQP